MADTITAIVDTQTAEFMPFGHALDARYVKVGPLPRNPVPAIEKYSGDLANPFVAKTPSEIVAAASARADFAAEQAFDSARALQAVALSNLARALGKAPSQLTGAEVAAERSRIVAIYKAL